MDHVETWRFRKRIEYLNSVQTVNPKSIITVLVKPTDNIHKIRNLISEEISNAGNIKCHQNRASVQEGLKSVNDYLKGFSVVPPNGIACFYGSSVIEPITEKEKRLRVYFVPPKPISKFVYSSDKTAKTDTLSEILNEVDVVGYIVLDGKGVLFACVTGTSIDVKASISVDLPRKHRKGGQSAARFARHREECRQHFLNIVCEKAVEIFITQNKVNVTSLILAGQAQFKEELEKSENLDLRLKQIVRMVVTVSYGQTTGLHEAIKLSADVLKDVRLNEEIKIIKEVFDLLSKGQDDMVAYGIKQTISALEEGAASTVIVYEGLDVVRWSWKDSITEKSFVEYHKQGTRPKQEIDEEDAQPLVEWLAENVSTYGSKLEIVSDASKDGKMLKEGFDGIAAILRYAKPMYDEQEEDVECSTGEESLEELLTSYLSF